MNLTFCSTNSNKIKELKDIIESDFNNLNGRISIESKNITLTEIQGSTQDICEHKCIQAYSILNQPVLVEDTGLEFKALNGLPGPYIKDFIAKMSLNEIPNLLKAYEDKSAEAVTVIGFLAPGITKPIIFEGRVEGNIVLPRGREYFGWDPIFQPLRHNLTYAEMTSSVKNSISHRRLAINQLITYLNTNC